MLEGALKDRLALLIGIKLFSLRKLKLDGLLLLLLRIHHLLLLIARLLLLGLGSRSRGALQAARPRSVTLHRNLSRDFGSILR